MCIKKLKPLFFGILNSEVVNAILSFYGKIKTLIQKKNIEFSFESILLGVSFEVFYRDGILTDVNFVRIGNSIIGKRFNAMYKEKFISAIESSYLGGIPYKIRDHDDIKVRGIITLNKEELKKYFKNDLSILLKNGDFYIRFWSYKLEPSLKDKITFLHNWYELFDKQQNLNNVYSNSPDVIFCCLMLNYPYQLLRGKDYRFCQDYPVNINKNLYEFIVVDTVKSNQHSSSNIDGFNYYSKDLYKVGSISFCANFTTIVKKECRNLKDILDSLRSVINCESGLYVGALRLAFKSNDKKDYKKVRDAELVEQINFKFEPLSASSFFNPENDGVKTTLDQLVDEIEKCSNFENVCNNYKTIYSMLNGFSENKSALGDLGEIIAAYIPLVSDKGYYPIKSIPVKSPSKPESTKHGIDLIYERTNPQTNTTEWLVIEVKVNKSQLSDGQASKKWVEENLEAAVGIKKSTEIKTAYNRDPSCLKVQLLKIDLSSLQKILKDAIYNTSTKISLSNLNDNGEIEQTESIETKLTILDLIKNIDKFKKLL